MYNRLQPLLIALSSLCIALGRRNDVSDKLASRDSQDLCFVWGHRREREAEIHSSNHDVLMPKQSPW